MIELLDDRSAVNEEGDVVPLDDVLVSETVDVVSADDYAGLVKNTAEIQPTIAGPFVDLGVRARALVSAADFYAHSNKLSGFKKTSEPKNPERAKDAHTRSWQAGDQALAVALGLEEMKDWGAEAVDVQDLFVAAKYHFKKTYATTNSEKSTAARQKLKQSLKCWL